MRVVRPGALGDPVTAAALRAMHMYPAERWSSDRLAAEAGVSRPSLARQYITLVGRPPMSYLTWWRVILAATMLRDTPDTLATIAGRVGYDSPYALSHAFEREFGTTPGRYRAAAARRSASDNGPQWRTAVNRPRGRGTSRTRPGGDCGTRRPILHHPVTPPTREGHHPRPTAALSLAVRMMPQWQVTGIS